MPRNTGLPGEWAVQVGATVRAPQPWRVQQVVQPRLESIPGVQVSAIWGEASFPKRVTLGLSFRPVGGAGEQAVRDAVAAVRAAYRWDSFDVSWDAGFRR